MSFYNLLKDSLEEFEENEFTVEDGENTVEEILAEEDSTVAIQNEVLEDGIMDADDVKIDLVEDEVEAMESIVTSLESLISQGKGLDPLSGALLNNHLNAISKRLGVRFITHSAESFENEVASLQAAQDSLESIKEKLSAAKDWVVESLDKMWSSFSEWITATAVLRKRHVSQAKKLLETVKSIDSDDPRVNQTGELTNFGDTKWILNQLGGHVETPKNLANLLNNSAELSKIIKDSGLADIRRKLVFANTERNKEFENAIAKFNKALTQSAEFEVPGGIITSRGDGKSSKLYIDFYKPNDNVVVKVLNKDDMITILEAIIKANTKAEKEESTIVRELDPSGDDEALDKSIKEAADGSDGEESEESLSELREKQKQYLDIRRKIFQRLRLQIRANANASKSALRWVSMSLAYKPSE